MISKALFDPGAEGRRMRVAAFMSGSGTNIRKLLELQHTLETESGGSPFEVTFVFSDRSDGSSQGERIAWEAGIPYFSYDIRVFHRRRGIRRTVATGEGLEARREYDGIAKTLVEAFGVDVIALGGYMSYISLDRCVNVHPADLTLLRADGSRRYVGDDAVLDAILSGETELRSSTLWTDRGVDTGPLLVVSRPLPVTLTVPLDALKNDEALARSVADEHQDRLKERGDWNIFPKTIQWIAEGRFALDPKGAVYFDGRPVPQGVRL